MKHRLLIIEDEKYLARQMRWGLSDAYDVATAETPEQARRAVDDGDFPLITLDLGLPPAPDTPEEGFSLLQVLKASAPYAKIIVITGNAERKNAIEAVRLGAVDFCEKPVDLEILKIILNRASVIWELERENRRMQVLARKHGINV